ncbi:hypothetical protein SNE40_005534 [Patella caerulea]|uniref:Fibrinogen C-terminal domain-containing protein n=1 Tax=Patella caerulea TaxID=87958 RepID=A0AAN8JX78_PATCE
MVKSWSDEMYQVLYLVTVIHLVRCRDVLQSLYVKTQVVEDKCFSRPQGDAFYVKNSMDCSLLCSNHPTCRRYVFCPNTANCKLYESGTDCIVPEGTSDGCKCFKKKYTCSDGSYSCALGFYGPGCQQLTKDCRGGKELYYPAIEESLIMVQPAPKMAPFEVLCSFRKGFTYIQKRNTSCTFLDFNRTHEEYMNGFGHVGAQHWLGLNKIQAFIGNDSKWLQVVVYMKDDPSQPYFRFYDPVRIIDFKIYADYEFWDLPNIKNAQFSTYDKDFTNYGCPASFGGGWWFADDPECCRVNVNGRYVDNNGEEMISQTYVHLS